MTSLFVCIGVVETVHHQEQTALQTKRSRMRRQEASLVPTSPQAKSTDYALPLASPTGIDCCCIDLVTGHASPVFRHIVLCYFAIFTIRSDPIRSDPIRSDPIRSDPIRSDPIRSDPIRSDPIRSDPQRLEQAMYSFADGRNNHNRKLRCAFYRFPPNTNSS